METVDNSVAAITDLDECIRVLAAALGYPDGAPPPPEPRPTPREVLDYARQCASRQRLGRIGKFRSLRSRGYTIAQAAMALGVSDRTAQRYEHEPAVTP